MSERLKYIDYDGALESIVRLSLPAVAACRA